MKHLKRFDESYRSLYHPISFSEYTDLASNMVEWSDRDINRIKSHPKLKGFEFGQYPPIGKGPVFFSYRKYTENKIIYT